MVAIIALGTFIGVKLDEKYPNKITLYPFLTLVSVIISIVYVIRRIIADSKDN